MSTIDIGSWNGVLVAMRMRSHSHPERAIASINRGYNSLLYRHLSYKFLAVTVGNSKSLNTFCRLHKNFNLPIKL